MLCPIHNKEMKEGKFGLYCATPIKDEQGNVLSWCKYKGTEKSEYKTVPTNLKPNNGRTQQEWDMLGRTKALCGMVNGILATGKDAKDVNLADLITLLGKIEDSAEFMTKDENPPNFF